MTSLITMKNGAEMALRPYDSTLEDKPKGYYGTLERYYGVEHYLKDTYPDGYEFEEWVRARNEFKHGPEPACSADEFRAIAADIRQLVDFYGPGLRPLLEDDTLMFTEGEIGFEGHPGQGGYFYFSVLPQSAFSVTKPRGSAHQAVVGASHLVLMHHLGKERYTAYAEEGCWGASVGFYRAVFPDRRIPTESFYCQHTCCDWDGTESKPHPVDDDHLAVQFGGAAAE